MPTNLTLFLKGSLLLFAKKDQRTGKVASLKSPPPGHVLTVTYRVKPPGGVFGAPQPVAGINLTLDVTNPVRPNITLRDEGAPIVRTTAPTHQDSFEWFVDLENEEVYGNTIGQIGVIKGRVDKVLTFNSGELFAAAPLSYNKLLVQKGSETNYTDFGFVAGLMGVAFSADRFVLSNGFDSGTFAADTEFRIDIENDAMPTSRLVTDANHYYKAVGSAIPDDIKFLFASIVDRDELRIRLEQQLRVLIKNAQDHGDHELVNNLQKLLPLDPPAGPEAACFPAYMGQTDL